MARKRIIISRKVGLVDRLPFRKDWNKDLWKTSTTEEEGEA